MPFTAFSFSAAPVSLDGPDASRQLGQMLQLHRIPAPFAIRLEWISAGVGAGAANRLRDQGKGGNFHVVGDLEVAGDARRPADPAISTYCCAARDAGAGGNRRMGADTHVVGHLDLVVELHPVLDHGIVERTTIHGGIGADLHVVADHHAPDLRHLDPASFVHRNPEAVGADDYAGMEDNAVADHAFAVDSDVGIKPRSAADDSPVADEAAGADHAAGANHRRPLHHGARADLRIASNSRRTVDDRGRVNARLRRERGIEQRRYLRKIGVGIGAHDARDGSSGADGCAHDHRPRPRRLELGQIALVGEERDGVGGCAFQRGDLPHRDRRVAVHLAAEPIGNLAQAVGNACPGSHDHYARRAAGSGEKAG